MAVYAFEYADVPVLPERGFRDFSSFLGHFIMACYSPLTAYRGDVNERGKCSILFKAPAGTERLSLPCGKCVGCRLSYSKQWAIRCVHEAQMWDSNCFLTLTFDDQHLPADSCLDIRVVQLFLKRLRKAAGVGIRFFAAGEYGGKFGRPHYHLLIFNYDFPDKVLERERMGNKFYISKKLESIWPFGFHSISDVTLASAAYVARYCVKKADGTLSSVENFNDEISGENFWVDKISGELRTPEFVVMSRGSKTLGTGGIGRNWFQRFNGDVFPSDTVIFGGSNNRPPRYYDNLLDKMNPDMLDSLKLKRASRISWRESCCDRLMVREKVTLSSIKSLKRSL